MRKGQTEPRRGDLESVRRLLGQLIAGDDEQRTNSSQMLTCLYPTLEELAGVLRAKRSAAEENVFLVSLRIDVGRRAVRQAIAELRASQASGGELQLAESTSAEQFLERVDEIAFGSPEKGGERDGGTALELYDSGRYERDRRSDREQQLITFLDEALYCRDGALRDRAFGLLWTWAFDISFGQCRDRELAHDVATDAIASLLRRVNSASAVESILSGVEMISSVSATLLGGTRKDGRHWPGLIEKRMSNHLAQAEISLDEAVFAAGEQLVNAGLATWGEGDQELQSPSPTECLVRLRQALNLCREQIALMSHHGEIGPRATEALQLILGTVERQLEAARHGEHESAQITVATVRRHIVVEPKLALPALRTRLRLKRPKSILRRILSIHDQLMLCGLIDENLDLRAAPVQDLSSMLEELSRRASRPEFRDRRRQRETMRAIAEFWGEQLAQASAGRSTTICQLPSLVEWRERIHVDRNLLEELHDLLEIDRTAAHNLVKRHLELLRSWGLLEEITDV